MAVLTTALHKLDERSIKGKAQQETWLLAFFDHELFGYLLAKAQSKHRLYLGKQAVWPQYQGLGTGRKLIQTI